jgi:hypothetical protein
LGLGLEIPEFGPNRILGFEIGLGLFILGLEAHFDKVMLTFLDPV